MGKRIISMICAATTLFGCFGGVFPAYATALSDGEIIEGGDIPLRLWYDEEAPITSTEHSDRATRTKGSDIGWERYSLPIGNGYLGVNVFGRTETERIQLTDKTLANRAGSYNSDASHGGLNNFSETYIDFGHESSTVSDYVRYLDLNTAISGVSYTRGGVKYTREYFASYPDKALVIRLDADAEGKLDFTLRPTVPYKQSYMATVGDRGGKTGTVTSSVRDGVGSIELSGKLEFWDVDFLGLYKVYTNGGTVTASTAEDTYTDTDGTLCTDVNGTIRVEGATSAYIVVTTGTDYELSSEIFTTGDTQKPTFNTTLEDTRVKVEGYMSAIEARISGLSFENAYASLKNTHIADYDSLFGRVSLEINPDEAETDIPTDELLEQYAAGDHSYYLETLMFQYGRYLLIASSREGTLPANLQGTWNTYETPAWRSGYWHNINVQMNYWPAFSTNLAELFGPYVDFNQAYMKKAEANATSVINTYNATAAGKDGGNGWCIGTDSDAYNIKSDRSAGNLGFTTQLFWEYYSFTKDEDALKLAYDVLVNAARFITKCVELDDEGHYLVSYCDSPEVHVDGIWYYTKGTTYAQTFAYLNNYNALSAAKALGIDLDNADLLSKEEYSVLSTVMEQLDKYDPIHVGLSGQIKEFREEDYYSSVGDDPNHRHISQLVGLYPGNLINGTTPAWLDAANATLAYRNEKGTGGGWGGWVYSHKMAAYARAGDGNGAGERLSELLSNSTCPNMLTLLQNLFQIDANFGATAGVSEMLLQSHAGYIEPLAAIPSDWANGSYTGLVARGNFEVGAEWKNGVATCFNITSNKGERASVYYPSITDATVTDADGNKIPYTVDGTDLISFDTEVGKTYIISGFKAIEKPNAPAKVSFSRIEKFGDFNLTWTPVDGAKSYNVYVAVENAPAYTLVGSTANGRIGYTPNKGEENARTTFAVTAVNADGIEGERTLCYYNPADTSAQINDVYGGITETGQLQVTVSGNENCEKYRLYEKTADADVYTQICESAFPLLHADTYHSSSTYAVSATSVYDGAESELFVITTFNGNNLLYNPNNILSGKEFIQAEGSVYNPFQSKFGYACLTDGIIDPANQNNGRFSSMKNGMVEATVDLGGVYKLYELKFYLYKKNAYQAGTNFTVEAYSGGNWVKILENVSNDTLVSDCLVKTGDGNADWIITIDMGGIEASKIKFHTEAVAGSAEPYVTFYECECSGVYLRPEEGDNILLGKEFVGLYSAATGYTHDKLTDGIIDPESISKGRFSSSKNGKVDATVELGGVYRLYELKFYLYRKNAYQAGTNFTLEAYSGGEWVKILDNVSNDTLVSDYLVKTGDGNADWIITVNMGGIEASKIRFYTESVAGSPEPYVTFYECECSGTYLHSAERGNVLLGKEFVGNYSAYPNLTYAKLTDGIIDPENKFSGRFSNANGSKAGGTIDLGGNYVLSELKFYLFERGTAQMGTDFTVEVYSNGEWVPIVQNVSNATLISDYLVDHGSGKADLVLTFPLGNIVGSKIRFEATPSSGWITFYECECLGYEAVPEYFDNLLLGHEFVSEYPAHTDTTNGRIYSYGELTDGVINVSNIHTGRFSNKSGSKAGGTIDLGGNYVLSELRFYLYQRGTAQMGTDFTVEVYSNGEWIPIVQNLSNETLINDYLVDRGTGKADLVLTFPMGNIIGSKIRFETTPTSGWITFYECECSGYDLFKRENEDVSANVLYGAEGTVSGGTVSASTPVANALDGSADTYLEVTGTNEYTVNIDFKFTRQLYTLKIYEIIDVTKDRVSKEVVTASDETTIEVYTGGKWMKIVNAKPLTSGGNYTVFNLYGVEASGVRITFKNTRLFDGETEYRTAKISEITCTTGIVNYVDRSAMIEALEKLSSLDEAGKENPRYLYDENYLRFKDYAADFTADQATVEGYAQEINAYYEELMQNPSYLVKIHYVDTDGYKVSPSTFKYFAANANVKMISSAVDGYYTRDVYVEGVADTDGKEINVVYKKIPANVDHAKLEEHLSDIVAWGDSITAGSGANNVTSATEHGIDLEALGSLASGANYVNVLKNLIQSRIYSGMAVDGCGIGGEATSSIAARADTETYYLYLDGAVTIGTDAVTVPLTHYASGGRVGILRQGGDSHVNPVTVKGFDADGNEMCVVGKLSVSLSDDAPSGSDIRLCDAKYLKYTFTRTDGGTDSLSFVSGARVITKSSYIYDGRTCIIFMGENGGYSDLDELIRQQEEILAACGNPEFFLIVSSTSGSNESRTEIREVLSERWGANYINMGDELNSSRASYELAGFSEKVIDSVEASIDAGTVTNLLLADSCHPNAVGYAVVGNVMFERLYDIGAFDAILDYFDSLNESENVLKLNGAYLNIANDINVIYSANVPESYENPYMVFEFAGSTYTMTEYAVGADRELLFAFRGVAPQMVGDNIKATLFATKDGVEESFEKSEYSVLTYCRNMLGKTDDEKLKTVLSDLLVYAAASQTYRNYKTDALVTEGLALTPSEFAPLTKTDRALLGESDARVSWKGVALRYENAAAMKFNFKADEALTLRVTVNGRVTEYTSSAWGTDENGNCVVYFRGILATEYDDVVTAAFYDGEEQVGQSVTYSVNSYVYSMQESENENLATLVQATYNYGASAAIYAGK